MRENNTFKITVKHGLYVGDLCYALKDEAYHNVWGKAGYEDGAYTDPETGAQFAMVSTAYGDGYYDGFPVDAGIIGVMDMSLAKATPDELDGYCGQVFEDYEGEVEISYEDGTITVSTADEYIEINTAYDEDEEDSEDEDENEEDSFFVDD